MMTTTMKSLVVLCVIAATCWAQKPHTTPVPILKQINRHNEDGSYSYGYEAADGSYKIETKFPTGEVYGKYGYVDDTGKVRTVEYGASQRGFEPSGSDIQVPPATLSKDQHSPLAPGQEDDGQYREDPSIYYKNYQSTDNRNNNNHNNNNNNYRQQHIPHYYSRTTPAPHQQPAFRPQPAAQYFPTIPRYYNPQTPQPQNNPYANFNPFTGHPATNVDLYTGSYTVNYGK